MFSEFVDEREGEGERYRHTDEKRTTMNSHHLKLVELLQTLFVQEQIPVAAALQAAGSQRKQDLEKAIAGRDMPWHRSHV